MKPVCWLRQAGRWVREHPIQSAAFVVLGIVLSVYVSASLQSIERADDLRTEIRAQNAYLVECTTPGPHPPPLTGHDCYDRSSSRTGQVLAELRRSLDCAVNYAIGKAGPQCDDVVGRIVDLQSAG